MRFVKHPWNLFSTPTVCIMPVRTEADVKSLLTQLHLYSARNGGYPSNEQGIQALVARPNGEPQPRKWRQIMQQVPIDPWGNPYQIRNPGMRSKEPIDVFSMGPDGRPNTGDDIGNW